MVAYTSIHHAHKIRAHAGTTLGAPLIIEIDRENGGLLHDEVTLFTDDHELSRMLADAITGAVAERNAVLSKQKDAV